MIYLRMKPRVTARVGQKLTLADVADVLADASLSIGALPVSLPLEEGIWPLDALTLIMRISEKAPNETVNVLGDGTGWLHRQAKTAAEKRRAWGWQALRTAADTIGEFLRENDMTVYLVIFDRKAYQISSSLFADITEYIDDHYADTHSDSPWERLRRETGAVPLASSVHKDEDDELTVSYASSVPDNKCALPYMSAALDDLLTHLDAGFSDTLLDLIDRSGKKDSEIYKRANVDRKLFSKIRSNPNYKPSKPTAIAFAIALELDLDETRDFISRAGYALSSSSKFDVIIEYFISRKKYDIFEINEALFAFDQSLLGA